jgi:hypothetical protein
MRAPINGSDTVRIWISGEEIQKTDPIYGWQVVRDPDRVETATSDIFYKIVFNRPVRLVIPLIEVSYITRQSFCLKCAATGKVTDFKPAASGSFLHVIQTNKLAQRGLKWILTSRCPFYPSFTSRLRDYIGRKLGIQITETDVQTDVINALSNMQKVQQAQQTVQTLDAAEMLKDIVGVNAVLDDTDPTTLQVSARISSFAGTSTPLGFTLRMN